MNCAYCHTELPAGAMFCGECGRSVNSRPVVEPVVAVDSRRRCAQCGSRLDPSDVFCGVCGFVVPGASLPVTDAIHVVEGPPEVMQPEIVVTAPAPAPTIVTAPAPLIVSEPGPGVDPEADPESPYEAEPAPWFIPVFQPERVVEAEPEAEPAAQLDPEPEPEPTPEPRAPSPPPAHHFAPALVPPPESPAPVAPPTRDTALVEPVLDPFRWGRAAANSAADFDEADEEETRIIQRRGHGERFVLQFSTGESVTVVGTGLIGRNPTAEPGEYFDHLVTIVDPGKSVSKTHLEFGQDAGTFWISDRFSGNGTVVREPELDPRRADPGKRYRVVRGTRIDLGEQFVVVS